MFLLRDLIKLPGKQGETFLSHCVITSVKACWFFLTWWIYFSSRYAIHLHPLLKLGWFVFFTFRRGVGGLWQSWEVSFGCTSHAGYQKLKMKMFFRYVVCFSVWESACMWLLFGRRGAGDGGQLSLQPGLSWDLPWCSGASTGPSARQDGSRQVDYFWPSALLVSL